MTNAASVQNLIKNVGCAVGTSSVGFLVSSYAQIYQSYLVDRMTMLSVPFSNAVASISAKFTQMGIDTMTATGMAQGKIYGMLIQQSTLCSFMNAYKIYAVLILILIPLVFVLREIKYSSEEF